LQTSRLIDLLAALCIAHVRPDAGRRDRLPRGVMTWSGGTSGPMARWSRASAVRRAEFSNTPIASSFWRRRALEGFPKGFRQGRRETDAKPNLGEFRRLSDQAQRLNDESKALAKSHKAATRRR
jgi:hypothetical protein